MGYIEDLKERYCKIHGEYVDTFCDKQDTYVEHIIENVIAETIYCISDCYFNFKDIKYDIDTRQPHGRIFKWYWQSLEFTEAGNKNVATYEQWCEMVNKE